MLCENKLLMFLVKKKHTLICGGNAELINISTQCRKTRAKSIYDIQWRPSELKSSSATLGLFDKITRLLLYYETKNQVVHAVHISKGRH